MFANTNIWSVSIFIIVCLYHYNLKRQQAHIQNSLSRNVPMHAKNRFVITSWNTNGVIQNSLTFKTRFRSGLQHPYFQHTDLLCLQEIFHGRVKKFALKELQKHEYAVMHHENTKLVPRVVESSGLVTCFRNKNTNNVTLNPLNYKMNVFKHRTSFDVLAQKGFLHSVTDTGIHILNLHIQSILREYNPYDTYWFSRISYYQRKQIQQIQQYIQTRMSKHDKIIILGDFNINPYFDLVNGMYLSFILSRLGFKQRPFDRYETRFDCQYLDHVWYKNLYLKKTIHASKDLLNFSDHLPVSTVFEF